MIIDYIIEQITPNFIVVTWNNLHNGDVGKGFQCAGYTIPGVEFSGVLGSGGSYTLDQANSINNPVYVSGNPDTNPLPTFLGASGNLTLIRPSVLSGDATTDITISMILFPLT